MELKPRAMTDDAKIKKRETLLDAAKQAFDENSYKSINMLQIAKLAGVSKGTLFVYFNSKEHLFVEVLFREYQVRYNRIMNSLNEIEDTSDAGFVNFFLKEYETMMVVDSTYLRLELIKGSIFESITADKGVAEVNDRMIKNAEDICYAVVGKFPQLNIKTVYELWTVEELMLISYANSATIDDLFELVPSSENLKDYFKGFLELALNKNGYYR
jgi:AcrR family transcriptional regulator